jgi:Dolichyl-phosphate-mannose-protein mannosyltransferase
MKRIFPVPNSTHLCYHDIVGLTRVRYSVGVRGRPSLRLNLCAMVVTAFALRVAAMWFLHSYRFPATEDHYLFGTEMGRIARSLVSGHGFGSPLHGQTGPTAMVGPIYPLLIAAAFKVWGLYSQSSAIVLLGFNALCSAITAPIVFLIGTAAFDTTVGKWAGWLWVVFPFAIYWPIRWVWDTSVSTLLFALVFLGTLRLAESPRPAAAARSGVAWGIAVLTNTTFLPLLPALVGWVCWRESRRAGSWIRAGVLVVFACGLILAPWIARNYIVFDRVLLRSNLGLELALGNLSDAGDPRAWQQIHPAVNPAEMVRYRTLGELRYMAEMQRRTMQVIEAQPATFIHNTAAHVLYFWFGVTSFARIFDFPMVLFGVPTFAAFLGLWMAVRHRAPSSVPFAATIVVFPLIYYVTHPDLRFRHLIEPELIVLAAYGVVATWHAGRFHGPFRDCRLPTCLQINTPSTDSGSEPRTSLRKANASR